MKKTIVASALSVMVMLSVSAMAASTHPAAAKTEVKTQQAVSTPAEKPAKKTMHKKHVAKTTTSKKTMVSKTTPKMTSVASSKTEKKAVSSEKAAPKAAKH